MELSSLSISTSVKRGLRPTLSLSGSSSCSYAREQKVMVTVERR